MISHTTAEFRNRYSRLPAPLRVLARKQYRLWKANPKHPSIEFKKIGRRVWSARISSGWRAVATPIPGGYLWFWIGPHDQYLEVIRSR